MLNYLGKIFVYACFFTISLLFSYFLKYNFLIPYEVQKLMWTNIIIVVPLQLLCLVFLKEFNGVLTYFRLPDLMKITAGLTVVSLLVFLIQLTFTPTWLPSREIILADLLFSILLILFFRGFVRWLRYRYNNTKNNIESTTSINRLKVAIIGANDTGSQVVAELQSKKYYGFKPTMFFDDNQKVHGKNIHGLQVLGAPEKLTELEPEEKPDALIIISQGIHLERLRCIIKIGGKSNLKTFIIPSVLEFITEKTFSTRIREVDFEDFLERDEIKLNFEKIKSFTEGKTVAVTGAGGSIGSELCRQIARSNPKNLLLIDHSEYNLFKIEQELLREGIGGTPILLDVTNESAVREVFKTFNPQIVYHAAAYKHVPLLERQGIVALKNNSYGSGILSAVSSEFEVENFVLVSTDKAINPINYMGASKRIAEILVQASNNLPGNKTKFTSVRFGNVLGSAGSVLPIFKEQISRGGPVTVTHPDTTRFFMTIPEAVGLILETATFQNSNGNIFVLSMGKAIKIVDVAKKMIELNRLRPNIDIDIVFTGLRPGEKLHEDLDYENVNFEKTEHPKVYSFKDSDYNGLKSLKVKEILSAFPQEESATNEFIRRFIPNFKN